MGAGPHPAAPWIDLIREVLRPSTWLSLVRDAIARRTTNRRGPGNAG